MPKLPQWILQLSGSDESIEPVLVPGNWFVTRAFAVPEGLKGKEIDEFAELSLEEISPFNLEQLNWGYFFSEVSNRLFVYAAFDQKLRNHMADSELYDYAFPDFAQTFGLKFEQATLIFLIHEATLCGVLIPANDTVPQIVVGISLGADFSKQELEEAKKLITLRIQDQVDRVEEPTLANPVSEFRSIEVSDKIYRRNWDFKESNSKPIIELVPYGDGPGSPWQVPLAGSSRLWAMDIRKADDKELLEKKHGWTLWYWRASLAVILLFFILAFSEIGLIGLSKLIEKEILIALADQPRAEEVQQKADILAKINEITTYQLLPFEMLDAINEVRLNQQNPKNIYFRRVTAENGNTLQIDVVSVNSTDVEGFENALKETEFLSSINITNFRATNNIATFRLLVEFKPGALQPQTFLTDL